VARTRQGFSATTRARHSLVTRSQAALWLLAGLLPCGASAAEAARAGAPGPWPPAGGARGAGEACLLLRLRERNLAAVQAAALRAGGLGPGAGAYLSADGVAALAGRTRAELAALGSFVEALGGRVAAVGPHRDAAAACFPPGAAAALGRGGAAAVPPARRRLLAAAADGGGGGGGPAAALAAGAAAGLAAALPQPLAELLHFVKPLAAAPADDGGAAAAADEPAAGSRQLLEQPPGGAAASAIAAGRARVVIGPKMQPAQVRPAPAAGSPAQVETGILSAAVPGPIPGTTLPWNLAAWAALTLDGGATSLPVPVFDSQTLMATYGVIGIPNALNNIQDTKACNRVAGAGWGFPPSAPCTQQGLAKGHRPRRSRPPLSRLPCSQGFVAVMLPCSAALGAGGAVANVSFATVMQAKSRACAATWGVQYEAFYVDAPGAPVPGAATLKAASGRAAQVLSCGAAAAAGAAAGGLPAGACAAIAAQIAAVSHVANDIGDATAIVALRLARAPPLPKDAGISYNLSLTLPAGVPEALRTFNNLLRTVGAPTKLPTMPYTPATLRKGRFYAARGRQLSSGAAKGLLGAPVGLFGAGAYSFSPADLAAANGAFKLPVPAVVSVVSPGNPNGFTPNNEAGALPAGPGVVTARPGRVHRRASPGCRPPPIPAPQWRDRSPR
jgi:hypothetical protein